MAIACVSGRTCKDELPVVLLPGLDGTGELFARFVATSPQGIRPIVIDYPTDETSIEVLEQGVRERLPDPCLIVAESFSGAIGVRIAADPRVQALVLCNSFVRSPMFPAFRHLAIAPLFAFPLPGFVLRRILFGGCADPAFLPALRSALRRVPARVIAGRVRAVMQIDERKTVQSLPKPILYLRGLRDRLVSERSWADLQLIRPDAQIVRIDGPHLLLQVSPKECWQAILQFVMI